MGLQYIDSKGIERTLTEVDMLHPDFQDSYSDLFKVLYGFRPRSDYFWSTTVMLNFFDTYAERLAEKEVEWTEERAERLAYLNHKHGKVFPDLNAAEEFNVQAARERYAREDQERAEAAALKERFKARYSPLPMIDAWEHGDRVC